MASRAPTFRAHGTRPDPTDQFGPRLISRDDLAAAPMHYLSQPHSGRTPRQVRRTRIPCRPALGLCFLARRVRRSLVIGILAGPALRPATEGSAGNWRETRASDLRFTGDEVACYLNDLDGLDLAAADMSRQP